MVDWCPQDALDLIAAWGFTHKTTAFTWVKQNASGDGFHMGQGYWTRANPEDCLLATRGRPQRLHADVRQLVMAPVMEHSRKPDIVHDRIKRLVDGPYLELYARRPRDKWMTWGNDLAFTLPPHDPETGEIIGEFQAPDTRHIAGAVDSHVSAVTGLPAASPQCTEAAISGEPSPEAGPQAEASHAGTGSGTPAGHAADSEGGGANAPATDLEIPPSLRRVALTAAERADLATRAAASGTLELNARQLVRKLADRPELATVDRRYLARIVAKRGEEQPAVGSRQSEGEAAAWPTTLLPWKG
jgi:hypothetical protein